MKKLTMVLLTLSFLTISADSQSTSAQSRCNLTEANAPSVRGTRLGMSTQQILALFPNSNKRREIKDALERVNSSDNAEPVYLSFDPATDAPSGQFAGVGSVSAGVYKGHVVDLTVTYVGASWTSIDEWVRKLAEGLKLPGPQDWVVGPSESPNKILRCSGIEIEAAIQGGSASIRLRNPEYLRGMEERTKAAEEKRRREVKP
jgi:hypothetical protein